MSSKAEKIGAALAKAVKAATGITSARFGVEMYRTNFRGVPRLDAMPGHEGTGPMQIQLLIDKHSTGADHVIGWTVLKPGTRHERHRPRNCDEFLIVLKGQGRIYSDKGEEPAVQGDVIYLPRGCWHGFSNTSTEDVVLIWGWMGAGSPEAAGTEGVASG